MKKALITGYTGFVGSYCSAYFKDQGYEVVGLNHQAANEEKRKLVDHEIVCDLSDPNQTSKLALDGIDTVINLAGFATNTGGDLEEICRINVGVHVNLYRRIAELCINPRIIAVSSGAVYDSNQLMPLDESSTLKSWKDSRPYEASKILMEQSLDEFGLDIVIARPFNHIGIGQATGFLVPDLIAQVKQAIKENKTVLVGNLNSKRDYTNVIDVVKAYYLLSEDSSPDNGVYNICSEKSYSGKEILDMILKSLGATNTLRIEVDPKKLRGALDETEFVGSYKKLNEDTGWEPNISIEETIDSIVKHERF